MKTIYFVLIFLVFFALSIFAKIDYYGIANFKDNNLVIDISLYNIEDENFHLYYFTLTDWSIFSFFLGKHLPSNDDDYFINKITFCKSSSNSCDVGQLDAMIVFDWTYLPALVKLENNKSLNLQIILPISDIKDSLIANGYDLISLELNYTEWNTFKLLQDLLSEKNIKYDNILDTEEGNVLKVKLDRKKMSASYMKKERKLKKEFSNYLKLTFRERLYMKIPINKQ